MPFLGDTQLKVLSGRSGRVLHSTYNLRITCLGISKGAAPRADGHGKGTFNPLHFFKQFGTAVRTLPDQLRNIFRV